MAIIRLLCKLAIGVHIPLNFALLKQLNIVANDEQTGPD